VKCVNVFFAAIAALSTTILTASTDGALAAKSKQAKQESLPAPSPQPVLKVPWLHKPNKTIW
jgi:hypothetical protein